MKRLTLAAGFALLLLAVASSQSSLTHQIAPGVWYRDAEPAKNIIANTGWVEFRDWVLVIDANFPWGARAVLPDLRKTTQKPIRFVFDTHYHGDHAFGNSVLVDQGAAIVCSEDCFAESKRKNPAAWAGTKNLAATDRLEHPQVAFRDQLVFDDGTQRVELIKVGPGHTLGDAIAWLPGPRILFTGDLCVNRPGNNIADPDADPDGWIRALDRMLGLDVAILIPGHGAQGSKDAIRGQRAYLADLIQQVRAGIARGAGAPELEKEINAKLKSSHKPWGQDDTRNTTSVRAVYGKLKR
jgi:glyoxylase-like metal-dependent hydrolase (beta-lactamase superfamily II)